MFLLLSPVPGIPTDPRTPDPRTLKVIWNGPTLIPLLNDLIPRSVILNPATVLSKLKEDLCCVMGIEVSLPAICAESNTHSNQEILLEG